MDGGGGAEQWRLGRRSSGARRHGGGAGLRGRDKEVR
jgi:hypothetical protein